MDLFQLSESFNILPLCCFSLSTWRKTKGCCFFIMTIIISRSDMVKWEEQLQHTTLKRQISTSPFFIFWFSYFFFKQEYDMSAWVHWELAAAAFTVFCALNERGLNLSNPHGWRDYRANMHKIKTTHHRPVEAAILPTERGVMTPIITTATNAYTAAIAHHAYKTSTLFPLCAQIPWCKLSCIDRCR